MTKSVAAIQDLSIPHRRDRLLLEALDIDPNVRTCADTFPAIDVQSRRNVVGL